MKRFAVSLLVLMALAAVTQAASPSYSVVDANYITSLDTTINSSATVFDSIIGHATNIDSAVILNDWSPKSPGWEYIMVHDSLVSAADSCTLIVVVNCLDANGKKLYAYHADTVLGTRAGGAVNLSIGGAAVGNKYDVMFKSVVATDRGSQIKLVRLYLYKRKAITNMSRWP